MSGDVAALPRWLELQARFLDEHPEVATVGTAFVVLTSSGTRLSVVRYALANLEEPSPLDRHHPGQFSIARLERQARRADEARRRVGGRFSVEHMRQAMRALYFAT